MLFLNLRNDANEPYSNLENPAYEAALERSAATFGAFAQLAERGVADARLIENDWSAAADGEQYARYLTAVDRPSLERLRDRHTELVRHCIARSVSA